MKSRIATILGFFLLVVLLPAISSAQTSNCVAHDVLKEYLKEKFPDERSLRVAAYDHVTGVWEFGDWNGATLDPLPKRDVSIDPANEPTVIVSRNARVAVFVINTNPVLYAAKVTGVTRTDVKEIENLRGFIGLFSGFLTTGVTVLSTPPIPSPTPAPAQEPEETPAETAARKAREVRFAAEEILAKDLNTIREALDPQSKLLGEGNDAIASAAGTVKKDAAKVAAAADDAVVYLQLAEADSPNAAPLKDAATLAVLDTTVSTDFSALRESVVQAAAIPAACPAVIAAINEAFKWELDGIPVPVEEKEKFEELWPELLIAIDKARTTCPESIGEAAERIGTWLRNHPPIAGGLRLGSDARIIVTAGRKVTSKFVTQVNLRKSQSAAADEVLAKRGDVLKQAAQVALLAQLQNKYFGGIAYPSACWLRAGVVEVQRAAGHDLKLPFTKVQNEDMSIKIRPTFASKVERRRDDIDKQTYHFARGFNFDLDTGLIWTPIIDREFKEAERPVSSATTPATIEKFPQQVSETTRAGKLAMFMTGRPRGSLSSLGLQLGFGLDTDNPSAFLGLGWSLGRYAKLSGGRTWQRVTRLKEGLVVDKTITAPLTFGTREVFDNDWYFALTLTLDDLPFFSPPKK